MPPPGLHDCLTRVLSEYGTARNEPLREHPLAEFIRDELAPVVAEIVGQPDRYVIKASPGQGNWATIPWCAVFDRFITTSAQSGYYPVCLFRADLSGVYLSLNQGVTEVEEKYKGEAVVALRTRAEDFCLQLGGAPANLPERQIALNAPGDRQARLYEAGSAIAAFYPASALPDEEELRQDLRHILGLYGVLSRNDALPVGSGAKEFDEPADLHIEDLRRFRQHKRIDRNAALVRDVKRVQGTQCRICGLRFVDLYGPIGQDYIEAHHLVPLHTLDAESVALDPVRDFAVLCANCHAMVHRTENPGDIEGFIKTHFRGHERIGRTDNL